MSETRYTPEQMREWADSPNSSHSTAAMLHQAATDAEQAEYQRRLTASMEELLRSAHCIAARRGEGTHWDRFAASIQALGIGPVTARTYRVLPSDTEDNLPMADTEPNGVDVWLIKWAISNCHTLARRRIKAGSTDSDWWGHVLRLCEKAGAKPALGRCVQQKEALQDSLTAERQKIREIVEARRWHKGAQGVNEEEAGMASRRLLEAIDSLVALTGDATEGQG